MFYIKTGLYNLIFSSMKVFLWHLWEIKYKTCLVYFDLMAAEDVNGLYFLDKPERCNVLVKRYLL